jgi:O-antigen ligase
VQQPVNKDSAVPNQPRLVPASSTLQSVAVFFVLSFLFLVYSRVPEFLPFRGVALVASAVALLFSALSGNLIATLTSRVSVLLLAFTAWAIVGVPFSVWPSAALTTVATGWLKTLLVFYVAAAGLNTIRECKITVYVLAFATVTIIVLTLHYGQMIEGRLMLGGGTLSNSNDLAMYLSAGAPFCLYAFGKFKRIWKPFWMATLALILLNVLKTGSRGTLLAIGVATVYMFVKSGPMRRAVMVGTAVVGVIVIAVTIPRDTLERYTTVFGNSTPDVVNEAVASRENRILLFKTSIIVTATNPIFGVGMDQFPVASASYLVKTIGTEDWHVTHNMYTQISSELGIPGFLLYMSLVVISFRNIGAVMRSTYMHPTNGEIYDLAFAIRVSWIVFLVAGCFSSIALSVPLLMLIGISEVLRRAVLPEPTVPLQAHPALSAAGRIRPPLNLPGSPVVGIQPASPPPLQGRPRYGPTPTS